MRTVRKLLAGATLGLVMCGAWLVGQSLVKNVQFARAEQDVQATRAQISNVQDMATVFKSVNKVIEPSVVKIDIEKTLNNPIRFRGGSPFRPFFNNDNAPDNGNGNGNANPQESLPFDIPNQPHEEGTGSGVIMEVDGNTGYIITNNHVAGGVTKMTISLSDGREITGAKVIGTDPKSDLAVVKIEADHLMAAKWGDSDTIEKGDIVLAFGSPFGYVGSMTHGIVSALNRHAGIIANREHPYGQENFIQVDAPINPGNSGGPLVDLHGDVVGINTAIATESGGFQGIGLAIPSNQAKYVFETIKTKGRVARGWLGVEIKDASASEEAARVAALGYTGHDGVIITGVLKGKPADGKLEANDIVTAINGKKTVTSEDLRSAIATMLPDSMADMKVFRDQKEIDVKVKLGEQPDDSSTVSMTPDAARRNDANQTSSSVVVGLLRVVPANADSIQRFGLDEGTKGAVVVEVRPGSPAWRGGLQTGDCITRINTIDVTSPSDLEDALTKADIRKGIMVRVTNKESVRSVFIQAEEN